ncbi:hypothetical protein HZA39_04240 [Candidatus Peregrinibacteria bacterium]|nr:hypothetical protein [Candidatus Peregrinibacteria bacterium]
MFAKILVPVLFFLAQVIISWYGAFTGSLSSKGEYFGLKFDSSLLRSFVAQFEYFWILIIINFLFTLGFSFGFGAYKSPVVIISLYILTWPLAVLTYNSIFAKEKLDLVLVAGLAIMAIGVWLVAAHSDIMKFLSK